MANSDLAGLYLNELLGGRYRIVEFVGGGGFCLVFKAADETTGTYVAVKVLKPAASGEAALEFETEGRLLQLLRPRSHVLNLLSAPENTDTINLQKAGPAPVAVPLPVRYLVVELANACLAELVVNRNALSWGDRLELYRDVVLGVHQMHVGQVVHRDLKSENALVFLGAGKTARACVADLGRSRDLHGPSRFFADAYLSGRGDLRFAPPELLHLAGTASDAVFRQADLYLLGSVLFELCTGQGITALVFGDPRTVLQQAMQVDASRRAVEYQERLAEQRALFEPVFLLAEQQMPSHLRHEAGKTLRQLCDADPGRREKRYRAERNLPPWGLGWLLRRVDVLIKLNRLSGTVRKYRKAS